jgi:hypothetical protein
MPGAALPKQGATPDFDTEDASMVLFCGGSVGDGTGNAHAGKASSRPTIETRLAVRKKRIALTLGPGAEAAGLTAILHRQHQLRTFVNYGVRECTSISIIRSSLQRSRAP